jgi:hypothetical protein
MKTSPPRPPLHKMEKGERYDRWFGVPYPEPFMVSLSNHNSCGMRLPRNNKKKFKVVISI